MTTVAENRAAGHVQIKGSYDYIVVGAGASGCVVAGDLSKTGADIFDQSSSRVARTPLRQSAIPASGSTMSAVRSIGACRSSQFLN